MVTTRSHSAADGTAASTNFSANKQSHHAIYSAGGTSASASVSASANNKYECNNDIDIIPNAPTCTSLQNECIQSQSSTPSGTKSCLYFHDEDEGKNNNTKVGRIDLKRGYDDISGYNDAENKQQISPPLIYNNYNNNTLNEGDDKLDIVVHDDSAVCSSPIKRKRNNKLRCPLSPLYPTQRAKSTLNSSDEKYSSIGSSSADGGSSNSGGSSSRSSIGSSGGGQRLIFSDDGGDKRNSNIGSSIVDGISSSSGGSSGSSSIGTQSSNDASSINIDYENVEVNQALVHNLIELMAAEKSNLKTIIPSIINDTTNNEVLVIASKVIKLSAHLTQFIQPIQPNAHENKTRAAKARSTGEILRSRLYNVLVNKLGDEFRQRVNIEQFITDPGKEMWGFLIEHYATRKDEKKGPDKMSCRSDMNGCLHGPSERVPKWCFREQLDKSVPFGKSYVTITKVKGLADTSWKQSDAVFKGSCGKKVTSFLHSGEESITIYFDTRSHADAWAKKYFDNGPGQGTGYNATAIAGPPVENEFFEPRRLGVIDEKLTSLCKPLTKNEKLKGLPEVPSVEDQNQAIATTLKISADQFTAINWCFLSLQSVLFVLEHEREAPILLASKDTTAFYFGPSYTKTYGPIIQTLLVNVFRINHGQSLAQGDHLGWREMYRQGISDAFSGFYSAVHQRELFSDTQVGFCFPPNKLAKTVEYKDAWKAYKKGTPTSKQREIVESCRAWMTKDVWEKWKNGTPLSKEEQEFFDGDISKKTYDVWEKWKNGTPLLKEGQELLDGLHTKKLQDVWKKYHVNPVGMSGSECLFLVQELSWKSHRQRVVGSCDGLADISSEEAAMKEVTTVAQMNASKMARKQEEETIAKLSQAADRLQSEAMDRGRAVATTKANGVAEVVVLGQQEWLNQHLASQSTSSRTNSSTASQHEPGTLLSLLPGVNGAIDNSKLLNRKTFYCVSSSTKEQVELETLLKAFGAKVVKRFTKKVDYLLTGNMAEAARMSYVNEAETRSIEVISRDRLHQVLLGKVDIC